MNFLSILEPNGRKHDILYTNTSQKEISWIGKPDIVLRKYNTVIFVNGCHEYAKNIVGRCPYGVWDSSGTKPDGSKGSEWKLSIWISNRAFEANEYADVLLHEASHALSFLTRECLDSDSNNYRKNAWDYFGGEEKFADAVVLYYGGSYNHYRDSGSLSIDEVDFIDSYIDTCLS